MTVDLSQFIPSFLEESFEGLELMEASLLNIEEGDTESIDDIFRAAHSIKGGAGTFGFENVTEFTHLVETLLDEMRDGRRVICKKDTQILLESVDCMRILIEAARDDADFDEGKIKETTELLEETLAVKDANSATQTNEGSPLSDNTSQQNKTPYKQFEIKFEPEHELAKTGNDPLFLFSALAELGELTLKADTQDIPSLQNIDAQELYLKWELLLKTEEGEDEVREVFEWVEDECLLEVIEITGGSDVDLQNNTVSVNVEEDNATEQLLNKKEKSDVSIDENGSNNDSSAVNQVATDKLETKNAETTEADKSKIKTKTKTDAGSIRVGVDKVDSLINLVGELVITQSMLSELGTNFEMSKLERLTNGLEQLLQNTKELQESVMRIRMLPISFAFNRFPRLIHDLANKMDKSIELVINGEQTELDKTVMEQIGDPLVHLVRNAVDHGIESKEERLASGKTEEGTITLDAYHQGGNIVIEISDDGGGINRENVFNKAVEKGIIKESSSLTDSQVFDLLFEPGFSTAVAVTDISGRGVGMDVVKRNIQSLGGRIQVESEQGKGSTFKVHLPLTLAILDGQLVKVGAETYIIPLISIVESLQVDKKHINRVSGDMVLYRLREDNVPVLPIYKLFNLKTDCTSVDKSLLVVVESEGQKVGLMVDDLLAQQQVVIKSLNENYQQVLGISGATILGDGSVAMILDIPGMIQMALSKAKANQQNNKRPQSKPSQETVEGALP